MHSPHAFPPGARRAVATLLAVGAGLASAGSASAAPVQVTLGFDDGIGTRNDPAQILAPHGLPATFYVNASRVDRATREDAFNAEFLSWDQLELLRDAGHEIGGHTRNHVRLTAPEPTPENPSPAGPTPEEVRTEVCDERQYLISKGFAARSFAYPYGRTNAEAGAIVQSCGYLNARTTSAPEGAERIPPANPFAVEAFNTGTPDGVGLSGAQMLALVQAAKDRGGGWVQFVFHDICDTDDTLCSGGPMERVTPRALKDLAAGLAADPEVRVRTAGDVVGAAADPTAPEFEETETGSSREAAALLRNDGGGPMQVGTVELRGEDGPFSVVADACTGATLAAGASCAISVRFAPTEVGEATAHLRVTANTDPERTRIDLSATAVAPAPVDPGPVDPGPVDPGPVDPGPVDPGPVDPGPVDPGPVDPGPVDPGPVDPGPVDPGPVDPGPVDPGPVDPGPVDPGPVDPGPVDPGPVDPGPVDPSPVDPGPVDPGPVDPGPVDPGPVNPGPVNPGPVDPGPVNPGPVDPGPVGPGPVGPSPADPGPAAPIPSDPSPAAPGPVAPSPVPRTGSGPGPRLDAAAVRRARAAILRGRKRAYRVCHRKASRPARVACRSRVRVRYARKLQRLRVAAAAARADR